MTSAALADDAPSMVDEIVVTATRTPVPLKTVGSAIHIITAEDIAERPRTELSDLLREVPGIAVNRSGQLGTLTQVRTRGTEANQTLVYINGINVGDPFSNGAYDFGNLLTEDVARVEVLRGPQSALYGAQAIGGVINIFTTEGAGPLKFKVQGEGGSHGTYQVATAANGGGENYSYAGSAAYLNTRGISQSPTGTEADGHHNLTLNARGRLDVTDQIEVTAAARYIKARVKADIQNFTFGSPFYGLLQDADEYTRSENLYLTGGARLKLFDGAWQHAVSVALTDVKGNTFDYGAFSFGSIGRAINVSYQTDATINDTAHNLSHALTGLVEVKADTYENKQGFPGPANQRKTATDVGYVGEYRLGIYDQVFLSGALRFDNNDLFQNATTYHLAAAWQIPNSGVKLRASYGTGFAKPGFYELFGFDPTSFVGNPNLKPETSRGWDVGTDISLIEGRAYFSFSYFSSNLRNEIFTNFAVFPFTAGNRAGISTRRGAEFSLRYVPMPGLTLAAAYTYTNSKDATGTQELRRPITIASLTATYRFLEDKAQVGMSADHNGKMTDSAFVPSIPSGVATLKSFTLVTGTASYRVTEMVEVFGRVENLLDQRYQEVFGFNTLGRTGYGGVRVRVGG